MPVAAGSWPVAPSRGRARGSRSSGAAIGPLGVGPAAETSAGSRWASGDQPLAAEIGAGARESGGLSAPRVEAEEGSPGVATTPRGASPRGLIPPGAVVGRGTSLCVVAAPEAPASGAAVEAPGPAGRRGSGGCLGARRGRGIRASGAAVAPSAAVGAGAPGAPRQRRWERSGVVRWRGRRARAVPSGSPAFLSGSAPGARRSGAVSATAAVGSPTIRGEATRAAPMSSALSAAHPGRVAGEKGRARGPAKAAFAPLAVSAERASRSATTRISWAFPRATGEVTAFAARLSKGAGTSGASMSAKRSEGRRRRSRGWRRRGALRPLGSSWRRRRRRRARSRRRCRWAWRRCQSRTGLSGAS